MNSVCLRSKYVSPYPELAAKWVMCKLALTVQVPASIPGHQLGKKQTFLPSEDSSTEYWQTLLCNSGAKYYTLSKLKSFHSEKTAFECCFMTRCSLCPKQSLQWDNHPIWFLLIIFPVKVSEERSLCIEDLYTW